MSRCDACPGVNNCLDADGPENSPYLFIGEAPGLQENDKKRVFIGKTGQEVNEHYMPLAGISRSRVCVTNAIRCLPISAKGKLDPKKAADMQLLQSCAEHHLYPHIARSRPKIIIPMGAFACRALDPSINLEIEHGIPRETSFGKVFPMYHPAGGLHEPKKMLQIRTDWYRLKRYIRGNLYTPIDEFEGAEDYRAIDNPDQVHEILCGEWNRTLACDTETTYRRQPFCLTFSVTPGTGYLIRAEDTDSLQVFQQYLDRWRGKILFHNWLFDSKVVEQMGLRFPRKLIVDTMVRVYQLGNLPQGLKSLAYRELGMRMKDFDDVVTPHSTARILQYLRLGLSYTWDKPEQQLERQKDGKWKLKQPQSMKTKIKSFFTYLAKDPEKNPFEMWTKAWVDNQAEIEEKCGEWIGKCITDTPFEDVIAYACRDSDSLLRIYPILNRMLVNVRRLPQERWKEQAA